MKLANVKEIVKDILESRPVARDDDDFLWVLVLEEVAHRNNMRDLTKDLTFRDFIFAARLLGLPHFKSVSRTRRKLQEQYPELRATEETRAARAELENQYKAFARNH